MTFRFSATCSSSIRSRSKIPRQFNQRAKLDEYDDFVFIIVYGAAPDDDRLVEVHCFYSALAALLLFFKRRGWF
jgi:hypothetical protein